METNWGFRVENHIILTGFRVEEYVDMPFSLGELLQPQIEDQKFNNMWFLIMCYNQLDFSLVVSEPLPCGVSFVRPYYKTI